MKRLRSLLLFLPKTHPSKLDEHGQEETRETSYSYKSLYTAWSLTDSSSEDPLVDDYWYWIKSREETVLHIPAEGEASGKIETAPGWTSDNYHETLPDGTWWKPGAYDVPANQEHGEPAPFYDPFEGGTPPSGLGLQTIEQPGEFNFDTINPILAQVWSEELETDEQGWLGWIGSGFTAAGNAIRGASDNLASGIENAATTGDDGLLGTSLAVSGGLLGHGVRLVGGVAGGVVDVPGTARGVADDFGQTGRVYDEHGLRTAAARQIGLLAAAEAYYGTDVLTQEQVDAWQKAAEAGARISGTAGAGLGVGLGIRAFARPLKGASRANFHVELRDRGFEFHGTTAGGYVQYRHPDGSRVWIRPDGEVVRLGPKVTPSGGGKPYHPRIDRFGNRLDTHRPGEFTAPLPEFHEDVR